MKYLVRLQPLNPFFFGGNKTFSSYNGQAQLHYISKSTLIPQQTHLLGMVRRLLLEKCGLLTLGNSGRGIAEGDDEKKAFELVGGVKGDANEEFGKIKTLSPVFLVSLDGNCVSDFHFAVPKDAGLVLEDRLYPGSSACISGIKRREAICFKNFEAKEGVRQGVTTSEFWKAYKKGGVIKEGRDILSNEEVYKEVWQTGIKRTNRTVNEDDDGSLYKKCSYSFTSERFQFGFILELKDDLFNGTFTRQVNLGAEQSVFQMAIEEFKEEYKNLYPASSDDEFSKAVVLGELFAGRDLFAESRFIVNEGYKPFGRLVPSGNSKSNKYRTRRTEQRNLLPRGSVIFFPEEGGARETLKRTLNMDDFFYSAMGYNQLLYI